MEEQNTLLMPFFDKSESFTNGFECGQVWEKLQRGERLENYLIHTCNIPQIKKIAELFLTEIEISENKDWSTFSTKQMQV